MHIKMLPVSRKWCIAHRDSFNGKDAAPLILVAAPVTAIPYQAKEKT